MFAADRRQRKLNQGYDETDESGGPETEGGIMQ